MLSEVFENFSRLSQKEISSFVIDLIKIRNFIKNENKLWIKLGFAHSIGTKIADFFSDFDLSPSSLDFLKALLKKDLLFDSIEKIIDSTIEELKSKADLEFIKCKTAFHLEKEDKFNLKKELEAIFKKETYIEYIVDRSISAGCAIEFREYNIDVSYKNSFSKLVKDKIIKEIMKGESNDN